MAIPDYYRQHKRLVLTVLIALAVVLTVGWVMKGRSSAPKYLTAKVAQGNITSVVQATGTINPLTTVPVGSYVSGTVKYIFADFNSHVEADQVLAQLDPAIYEAQVIQARGNLGNAQGNVQNLEATLMAQQAAIETNRANLAKSKAAADYARVNTKRVADLARQGVISQDQADQTQSGLEQADAQVRASQAQLNQSIAQLNQTRAQLASAKAQVETMHGALAQAETNLRYTTIISPIAGTIVARNVDVGQSVAASLQAPVVFSIAQDLKRMQVFAATDESDTGNIHIGTEATFQVDAFPADTFRGRISAIRLNPTTIQNVVTYNTVIDFDNPDEKLLPGETAYVTIPTGHARDTVKVPNAALRFTPQMPPKQMQQLYKQDNIPPAATTSHLGGWQVVWEQTGDKLKPVAIKAGITDYTFTQLLDGPLKEGDVLVTGEELAQGQAGAGPGGPPRFGGPRR